jgi:hypothetical protein
MERLPRTQLMHFRAPLRPHHMALKTTAGVMLETQLRLAQMAQPKDVQ